MLTVTQIRNAKPKTKQFRLHDRDGLYLVITPSGNKLWRGKYRVEGKEKTLSIGRFPEVTLAKARDAWTTARQLRDPSAVKRQWKEEKREQPNDGEAPTFEQVARDWHARKRSDWTQKHAARAVGVLFRWKIGLEDRLQHQHRCLPTLTAKSN